MLAKYCKRTGMKRSQMAMFAPDVGFTSEWRHQCITKLVPVSQRRSVRCYLTGCESLHNIKYTWTKRICINDKAVWYSDCTPFSMLKIPRRSVTHTHTSWKALSSYFWVHLYLMLWSQIIYGHRTASISPKIVRFYGARTAPGRRQEESYDFLSFF